MSDENKALQVTIVGGGMIVHDQLLPSLFQLQRLGLLGEISVCARHSASLRALAESESIKESFPEATFIPRPDLSEDPDKNFPHLYREAIAAMPPRNLVVVAVPDQAHDAVIREALNADQHILCVKPLVQRIDQAFEIEKTARERGLFIGVEYHKRFDHRALLARKDYRKGRFGEFRVGEAKMIEPFSYRHSNFQNWFAKKNADPFTYVGCHYIDQVYFITGLRPVEVSVVGIEGKFSNGNEAYMWSSGRVIFENGGVLTVINGLGYPDEGAGSNDQGITLYCDDGERGAIIKHNDQFRSVSHCYAQGKGPGGSRFNFVNPDYFKFVPWEGEGLKPVGYGHDSIEAIVRTVYNIETTMAGLSGGEALKRRQGAIRGVDEKGLIATPANSYINELVTEAGRASILDKGRPFRIHYAAPPYVEAL